MFVHQAVRSTYEISNDWINGRSAVKKIDHAFFFSVRDADRRQIEARCAGIVGYLSGSKFPRCTSNTDCLANVINEENRNALDYRITVSMFALKPSPVGLKQAAISGAGDLRQERAIHL